MDTRTSRDKRLVPNAVITGLRNKLGWGRARLAKEFELVARRHGLAPPTGEAMQKQIYRLETGNTVRPTLIYAELYCLTFDRTTVELFGDLAADVPAGLTSAVVRSHKFVPVFLGATAAAKLVASGEWVEVNDQWTECRRLAVEHPAGRCDLYVWPFGVVVFHLVEELTLASVAELAVWRRMTYETNMQWAREQLEALTREASVSQQYVLSPLREPAREPDADHGMPRRAGAEPR